MLEVFIWILPKANEVFRIFRKQGKSEGFNSCDRHNNHTQIAFKSIFQPIWPWNLMDDLEIWWMTLKNNSMTSLLCQALCIISNPLVNSNWSHSPERHNSGQIWQFFVLCDLNIWWMTLQNNRAPLLYHVKLCASFQSHGWIQSGNVQFGSKSVIILSRDLGIWQWPSKTIGHLFYSTSSFVHHFKAMGELKLELQSGNAQFGSKPAILNLIFVRGDLFSQETLIMDAATVTLVI